MTSGFACPYEKRTQPGAVEPGAHPTRHSGRQHARHQPQKAKRSTDSVGGPSRKIEANWRAWVMSAQLPGLVGLQKSTRPSPSVTTMVLTAFCLFLPEMNLSRWWWRDAGADQRRELDNTRCGVGVARQ